MLLFGAHSTKAELVPFCSQAMSFSAPPSADHFLHSERPRWRKSGRSRAADPAVALGVALPDCLKPCESEVDPIQFECLL